MPPPIHSKEPNQDFRTGIIYMKLSIVRYSLLAMIILTIPSNSAHADDFPICLKNKSGRDSPQIRKKLLEGIKKELLNSAKTAESSLTEAQKCFTDSMSKEKCSGFRKSLMSVLTDQIQMAKLAQSLTWKNVNHLQRLSLAAWVHEVDMDSLRAEEIANFKQPGFHYSNTEKEMVLNLWKRAFLRLSDAHLKDSNLSMEESNCNAFRRTPITLVSEQVRQHFSFISSELIRVNPLLAFLTEESLKDDAKIRAAFDRLIKFNQNFIQTINGYETEHSRNFWSYLNLTTNDHEMGLINFSRQAESVIQSLPEEKVSDACASWSGLKRQQSTRVKSSIGVGFTTAVVCGVGIWSGVGTLPSAAFCSFAVADGLWGGYRGYDDAKLSQNSAYAGRIITPEGKISKGVRDFEEAAHLSSQGNVVFLINMIGILPVAKGVASAAKGGRGELVALAKLPASDSAVSYGEVKSGTLASFMKFVKLPDPTNELKQSYFHKSKALEFARQCRESFPLNR